MNRSRSGRRYDREFKNNAFVLVRGGRTITEVAGDLGVSKWSMGHWVGRRSGPGAQRAEDAGFRDARAARTASLAAGPGICESTARHFRKSLGHLVGGDATARLTVMEKLEHQYPADALAEALDVSKSGFAAHCDKQNGQRRKEDAELRVLIVQGFKGSRNTYGSPRVRLDLCELGDRCGKNRVCQAHAGERPARSAEAPFATAHN
jgi:transposase-like protein